jgi:hypothetical protein
MAQNRLNGFVLDTERVEIRRKPAAKSVPAVPAGKGIIALENVPLGFVLIFVLAAATQRRMAEAKSTAAGSSKSTEA